MSKILGTHGETTMMINLNLKELSEDKAKHIKRIKVKANLFTQEYEIEFFEPK